MGKSQKKEGLARAVSIVSLLWMHDFFFLTLIFGIKKSLEEHLNATCRWGWG